MAWNLGLVAERRGAVHHWPLDESSGSSFIDIVSGLVLTATGTLSYLQPSLRSGGEGTSVALAATSARYEVTLRSDQTGTGITLPSESVGEGTTVTALIYRSSALQVGFPVRVGLYQGITQYATADVYGNGSTTAISLAWNGTPAGDDATGQGMVNENPTLIMVGFKHLGGDTVEVYSRFKDTVGNTNVIVNTVPLGTYPPAGVVAANVFLGSGTQTTANGSRIDDVMVFPQAPSDTMFDLLFDDLLGS